MKVKVDENLPAEVAELFRQAGHEADTVTEEGLSGEPDSVILDRVRREGRVLVTLDVGIADVRVYPPDQYHGIILLRLKNTGRSYVMEFLKKHLSAILQFDLPGHLLIVSENGIRYR
ncbi:MAG: DUF5615 family PIN-like protein [Armatimonadetes bacterium]|nr:DUF5615 family PIN-like protein [Armatimonadota bacterium]